MTIGTRIPTDRSDLRAFIPLDDGWRRQQLMQSIRRGDRMAVDGFRPSTCVYGPDGHIRAVRFTCGSGYRVDVLVAPNDTYTVRRTFVRAGREWVKGQADGVYVDRLSDVFYRAGMFRDDWPEGGTS